MIVDYRESIRILARLGLLMFSKKKRGGITLLIITLIRWRRGRDSNPRYRSRYTPLAGERLRPLGHLSVFLYAANNTTFIKKSKDFMMACGAVNQVI